MVAWSANRLATEIAQSVIGDLVRANQIDLRAHSILEVSDPEPIGASMHVYPEARQALSW
jgi:hypothetical protein